jgi:hypothetical protein
MTRSPDVVIRDDGPDVLLNFVNVQPPLLLRLPPAEAKRLAEGLWIKATIAEQARAGLVGIGIQSVEIVGRPLVTQHDPYGEQRDGQLEYLDRARKALLAANDKELLRIARHARRKKQI